MPCPRDVTSMISSSVWPCSDTRIARIGALRRNVPNQQALHHCRESHPALDWQLRKAEMGSWARNSSRRRPLPINIRAFAENRNALGHDLAEDLV